MAKKVKPILASMTRYETAAVLRTRLADTSRRFKVARIHLGVALYNYLRLGGEQGKEQSQLWGIPVFADRSLSPTDYRFLEQAHCPSVEKTVWEKPQS